MTKRAILWCGQVREPARQRDEVGRLREVGDPMLSSDDATIQCNSLDLAFRAALELGVPQHEIYACVLRDDLLPQRFDLRRNHRATVDGLRSLVRHLARQAGSEDALLFIAVNHCDKNALATADPVNEIDEDLVVERLSPEVLDGCLRQLPGSQVVVVATCHAGIFLSLPKREGRAILVACAADEVYRVSRQDCKWPAFLDELFGAWCGTALSDAVPRERLPLDAAFTRAEARLAAEQVPFRAGAAVWPAEDVNRTGRRLRR